MKTRLPLLLLALLIITLDTRAQSSYLYKAKLVQAAPGQILDVIDMYKTAFTDLKASGDEPPFWMRHSQGDHWDLLILFPIKSYTEYYSAERIAKRKPYQVTWARIDAAVAWQEDLFVYGPPPEDLRTAFAQSTFFHVEMFHSLAGKQGELFKERQMENAYLKTLKRPEKLHLRQRPGRGLGSLHTRSLS